ncbi:MAG: hypothetical protein RI922_504 [Bacteroidota bacterium]|jgi:hypothetical protein
MKSLLIILFLVANVSFAFCQNLNLGPGIGFYPTGTEAGLGFRSAKNTTFLFEARITKFNLYNNPKQGSFNTETSLLCRIAYYDRVRLHLGLGFRGEWTITANQNDRLGVVMPLGVEAFPFPFQNAGLFFEVAPYFTTNSSGQNYGLRTVAGFAFYFIKKDRNEKI